MEVNVFNRIYSQEDVEFKFNLAKFSEQNQVKIMFGLSEKKPYEFNIIMFLLCVEQGRDTTANQMGMQVRGDGVHMKDINSLNACSRNEAFGEF